MTLKSFRTFENDERELLRDLDSIGIEQHKGWIVCTTERYERDLGTSIYAVVARNEGEASKLILENRGVEDEDDLARALTSKDFMEGLEEVLNDIMAWDGDFRIVSTYENLQPKRYEDYCLEIDWTNPVMAVKDLKSVFTNVDQIMGGKGSSSHTVY